MSDLAAAAGIECEIYWLERIATILDHPSMHPVRKEFLNIEIPDQSSAGRQYREDCLRLTAREDERAMTNAYPGPTFHLGILPREFYEDRRLPSVELENRVLNQAPVFDAGLNVLRGCEDGIERVVESIGAPPKTFGRFFIGHDWFAHAFATNPFNADGHHLTIAEFDQKLPKYMKEVEQLLCEQEGLEGPFCVSLAVKNLRSSEKLKIAFPSANAVSLPKPRILNRIAAPETIETFCKMIREASCYR